MFKAVELCLSLDGLRGEVGGDGVYGVGVDVD